MARRIDALLAEYGKSHQNRVNKALHWVCVPVIVWAALALIWSLPVPQSFRSLPFATWASPVLAGVISYYIVVSWQLAIGFILYVLICFRLIVWYEATFILPLWQFAALLFVLAWVGQFWGHKVEGQKPSFFKDLQFLLIGPAWLLHFLYKRFGIGY